MKIFVFGSLANLHKYFFILEAGKMELLDKPTSVKQYFLQNMSHD